MGGSRIEANLTKETIIMLTIDEAIAKLTKARTKAKLGGETVLHVCIDEVPYIPVKDIKVENDEDGAVVLCMLEYQP